MKILEKCIPEVKELLKQDIVVKAQGICLYLERQLVFEQNTQFNFKPPKFSQVFGENERDIKAAPTANKMERFWKGVCSVKEQLQKRSSKIMIYASERKLEPYNN